MDFRTFPHPDPATFHTEKNRSSSAPLDPASVKLVKGSTTWNTTHPATNKKKRLEIPTNGWFGLVNIPLETKGDIFSDSMFVFFFLGGKVLADGSPCFFSIIQLVGV